MAWQIDLRVEPPLEDGIETVALNAFTDLISQLGTDIQIETLERVIVTSQFHRDILEWQTAHGQRPDGATDDPHYGTAIGKVISYWSAQGFTQVMFLDAWIFLSLFEPSNKAVAIHAVHHELCHIHDNSVKAGLFKKESLVHRQDNLVHLLRVYADQAWSEYIACRLSVTTSWQHGALIDEVHRVADIVKTRVQEYIARYGLDGDIDYLFARVQEEAAVLLKQASSTLGWLHGLESAKIQSLIPDIVNKDWLRKPWISLGNALAGLHASHYSWSSIEVYDQLGAEILRLWNALGICPRQLDRGLYVSVP